MCVYVPVCVRTDAKVPSQTTFLSLSFAHAVFFATSPLLPLVSGFYFVVPSH